MAKFKKISIDFGQIGEQVKAQFAGLDPKNPSVWPILPRYALFGLVALAVLVLSWFVWLSDFQTELETDQASEQTLKDDFEKKLTKAVNLDALKKQREQVQQYVT
ncbi:MAG: type 4a pilus biogenesis protein PilO, partial [Curvibacter sp.]|nr:type 4a pilus biogenesis protein PilO [Curvibacter sp.]